MRLLSFLLSCRWLVVLGGVFAVGCGSPSRPTPPIFLDDPPSITCPAPMAVQSRTGEPSAVSFDAAIVVGGSTPITTVCTPESGASFPIGSTIVTCTAIDALQRNVSCSFAVIVAPPPQIGATRFLAFGDSITEGKLSLNAWMLVWRPETAFPLTLQDLLAQRYTAQTIVVVNEGLGGESIAAGVARLPRVLALHAPEVLLLLEGVNDLNGGNPAAIPTVVNGLRLMVREARGRGIRVFLCTLLPERSGGFRAGGVNLIPIANDQIRSVAASEGAFLVDMYQAFIGDLGTLIGDDGLHPTPAGYQKMAEVFFESVREHLEVSETSTVRLLAR